MAREFNAIDISNELTLLRLAEEVAASGKERILRRDNEDPAILMPVKSATPRRRSLKTSADLAAFHAAAGSWKDMDTDEFIADNYESRRLSSRSPVDL